MDVQQSEPHAHYYRRRKRRPAERPQAAPTDSASSIACTCPLCPGSASATDKNLSSPSSPYRKQAQNESITPGGRGCHHMSGRSATPGCLGAACGAASKRPKLLRWAAAQRRQAAAQSPLGLEKKLAARSSARARSSSARLGAAREPRTSRAEPSFLARQNSEPSRAGSLRLASWAHRRPAGPSAQQAHPPSTQPPAFHSPADCPLRVTASRLPLPRRPPPPGACRLPRARAQAPGPRRPPPCRSPPAAALPSAPAATPPARRRTPLCPRGLRAPSSPARLRRPRVHKRRRGPPLPQPPAWKGREAKRLADGFRAPGPAVNLEEGQRRRLERGGGGPWAERRR